MSETIQRLAKRIKQSKRDELRSIELNLKREELEQHLNSGGKPLPKDLALHLKCALRNIDHELDILEDSLRDNSDDLLQDLLKELHLELPEIGEKLQSVLLKREELINELADINYLKTHLKHFYSILTDLATVCQRVKGRGLLSYVFGENPNHAIYLHLTALKEMHPVLAKALVMLKSQPNKEAVLWFMKDFTVSPQSWGYRRLDQFLKDGLNYCSMLQTLCTKLSEKIENERNDTEKRLEKILAIAEGPQKPPAIAG